jgi:quinol monooxygenase YgiN
MSVIDAHHHGLAPDLNPSRRIFVTAGLASGFALAVQAVSAEDNGGQHMEIKISPKRDVVTLINIFVVEPDDQEKLIRVLKDGTETFFSKQPGYISASFHKSKDGRRVINYGQWRSQKDIEAYRSIPEVGEYFKRVRDLAQFESMECEVSYVHHA